MPPAAKHAEEIFVLAAGVPAALAPRQGTNADSGKKPHQGIFSEKRSTRVSAMWVKCSGTHQFSEWSWLETVLGPTNYLYDGDNLLETVGSNGSLIARYVEGQTVDEPFAQWSSAGAAYYNIDALSSVTSLSNSSAAISNTNTYDSFGNLVASTDTNTNPFRYTGRELDPETGLNFYRARYYDSSVGRFLSEDPLRFRAGIDFYRYVSNDPINATDPYGLAQLCCRIARSVYWLGIKGCHCFLKFDDGTTYGGYWKWSTYLLLEKRVNENDDRNPKDPPSCKDVPGSECAMRRAFNDLPRFQPYGLGGSSNSIPAAILTLSGSQFAMPSCAFGAFPFNLRELGNPGPVPIDSVPNVSF